MNILLIWIKNVIAYDGTFPVTCGSSNAQWFPEPHQEGCEGPMRIRGETWVYMYQGSIRPGAWMYLGSNLVFACTRDQIWGLCLPGLCSATWTTWVWKSLDVQDWPYLESGGRSKLCCSIMSSQSGAGTADLKYTAWNEPRQLRGLRATTFLRLPGGTDCRVFRTWHKGWNCILWVQVCACLYTVGTQLCVGCLESYSLSSLIQMDESGNGPRFWVFLINSLAYCLYCPMVYIVSFLYYLILSVLPTYCLLSPVLLSHTV